MIRVSIYNEFVHEQTEEAVRKCYPQGIHATLKAFLESDEIAVRSFTLDSVGEITREVLDSTDVMIWWGHMAHDQVPDEVAVRVKEAVLRGMGIIFLHSGHHAKPFKLLMGTSCNLTWREDGDFCRVWTVNPAHPITQGVGRYIELPHEETYGEPFGIPEPDEVLFISWYEGGEIFRSGCTFHRGNGRIFYFQPGHETFPTYTLEPVQRVILNAIHWAKPICRIAELDCPHVKRPGEE